MKHYELSVYASDSSFNLNIEGVYQAENKLLVLANLKNEPGISLCEYTWFSVGLEIDAPEDLPVECYLIGGSPADEKMKKAYIPIIATAEEANKLFVGKNPVKFTQTELNPDKVEFVIKYKELQERKRNKFDEIVGMLAQKAEERRAEFKKQGKEIEPVDPWEIQFGRDGYFPIVSRRLNELAEQNQLENKEELQKLIDKCTLGLNKLIKPKLSFIEQMEKSTGVSRRGLYAAAATATGVLGVAAAGFTLLSKSRP